MPRPPPCPIPLNPLQGPWPLHDVKSSRVFEQAALAGVAPGALMAAAGLAVARLALALAPHAARVQFWCGPGNNGGDGLVAARHLHAAGREVGVCLLGDAGRLPPDAAQALAVALAAGVPIAPGSAAATPAELHVDALLGIGASRAPEGPIAAAIQALNRQPAPVLAVDLPSGLNADTGTLLGAEAVHAAATLALLTLKPGCHTGQGRDHAGQVWLDRLGVAPSGPAATAWLGGPPPSRPRRHASHKGSFGDVWVVGGAPGMAGAAWLAARAALAAGAGRVYCCLLDAQAPLLDSAWPELMGRHHDAGLSVPPLACGTVVCGCGGATHVAAALPALLASADRLVLDADALNTIATDAQLGALTRARAGAGQATLMTPHPLEAARLLGCDVAQVQRDRLAAAAALAAQTGAAVLLKGSGSVIAAPGRPAVINPSGNAALASAGTGDVLAGWAGGLWAQSPSAPAAEVAAAAAWWHGHAADLHLGAGQAGPLRASDLVEAMASVGRSPADRASG